MEPQHINETLDDIFTKLSLSVGDTITSTIANQYVVSFSNTPPELKDREVVWALSLLTRKILEKKYGVTEAPKVVFDVLGQGKHLQNLLQQARTLAARSRALRCDVEMPPISSYDRMIVHDALKQEPGIRTESHGEGDLRHVVISYSDESS